MKHLSALLICIFFLTACSSGSSGETPAAPTTTEPTVASEEVIDSSDPNKEPTETTAKAVPEAIQKAIDEASANPAEVVRPRPELSDALSDYRLSPEQISCVVNGMESRFSSDELSNYDFSGEGDPPPVEIVSFLSGYITECIRTQS